MRNLQTKYGNRALVTGASSGIGRAFALELAKQGIEPVLVARNKERLESTAKEILEKYNIITKTISTDLSKEEAVKGLITTIDSIEIGLFVHCAGIENNGSFEKIDTEKELQVIHLNITSTYLLSQYFAKKMKQKGRGGILLVSSMVGLMPSPYFSNYAASKAYVHNLGLSLFGELRNEGVDVSVLAPGLTDTPMADSTGVDWSKIPMASMSPEKAVKIALHNLGNKATIIPGIRNKMMVAMAKRFFSMKTFSLMNGLMIRKGVSSDKL